MADLIEHSKFIRKLEQKAVDNGPKYIRHALNVLSSLGKEDGDAIVQLFINLMVTECEIGLGLVDVDPKVLRDADIVRQRSMRFMSARLMGVSSVRGRVEPLAEGGCKYENMCGICRIKLNSILKAKSKAQNKKTSKETP